MKLLNPTTADRSCTSLLMACTRVPNEKQRRQANGSFMKVKGQSPSLILFDSKGVGLAVQEYRCSGEDSFSLPICDLPMTSGGAPADLLPRDIPAVVLHV
jgi:hypothetical protein